MLSNLIDSSLAVLQERFKDRPEMTAGKIEITANMKCIAGGEPAWYATIVYGVPETCAALMYQGGGNTIEEAVTDLSTKINGNNPEKSEVEG